jgi:aminoglycoside 6'-N-acetyltransferase
MKADADEITFRPVTDGDLPMLRSWMVQPHWQEWWGDAETELGYVRDMIEGRDTTRPYLFLVGDVPMGYIQYWFIDDHRREPWLTDEPWIAELPAGSIGVDLSIGDAAGLGKGLGSAALAAFVRPLWDEGFREIIIDPDPANARAVRAYHKAGFRTIDALKGRFDSVHLMRFDPNAAMSGEEAA